MNKTALFVFVFFCTSCVSYQPFYNSTVSNWQEKIPADVADAADPEYSVYLLGDSRLAFSDDSLLSLLELHLEDAGEQSAVIFLGNNVHPNGLPDSTERGWEVAQESLDAQMELLKGYEGEIIIIPGNRDWANGRQEGLEYVKNQRKYIENYLDESKVFLPKKGRPGPTEIHLTNDIGE